MKKLVSFLTALALALSMVMVSNPAYGDAAYANDLGNSGKWWENIPQLGFPGRDVIRVHVDLSLSRAPLLGQSTEAKVTIKLNSKMVESLGGFTEAVIVLPEGFALVNGTTSWRGYVPKSGSIKFNATLQSVETGDWKIEAFARSGGDVYWEYGGDQIYISVSETTATMRKTEEPYVDSYDNTEHPVQTQHGEGLIPEKMTTEYTEDASDGVSPLATIYTVTISATLHITVDEVLYPRRMVKVDIMDSDPFPDPDDHLGTTYTDDDGYFEITVSHGDPNGIDIYWRCFLDSPSDRGVLVTKQRWPLPDDDYVYVSQVWSNLQDGSYYLGDWTISGGAPNIYHQITNAWYYLAGEVGYQTPKTKARWPFYWPIFTSLSYDDDANEIRIPGGWEYENNGIIHEYGHRVMNAVYGYIPYGPRAETWFEVEDSKTAWAEGWAHFFSLLIMNDPLLVVAESHGLWWLPITVNYETRWNSQGIPWDSGDNVEANVTAALWDLYDSADDGYDSYDGGFSDIWGTISSQTDDTYEDFYDAWVARGHSLKGFTFTAYQNTINYGLPLYPTDDADVYERYPNNNYGSDTSIYVSPYDSRRNRGFLKFSLVDIPEGATIVEVKLHLYAWQVKYEDFGAVAHEVLDDSWSEHTITWNDQPAYGYPLDDEWIDGTGWHVWDVTSFVAQEFADDKVVSLCLKGVYPETQGGLAKFDSKEWFRNHPHLFVRFE